jgi:hypothetical protein
VQKEMSHTPANAFNQLLDPVIAMPLLRARRGKISEIGRKLSDSYIGCQTLLTCDEDPRDWAEAHSERHCEDPYKHTGCPPSDFV